MTSIASYRAGLGYCIYKKQTTDLFISGGVLLFSGVINFSFEKLGSDSNLLIVFYVQIMPDDLVMQLH
ncbi:hypothetical protein P2P22_22460, partial [Escherichia coli]